MEQKAFNLIAQKVEQALAEQGFARAQEAQGEEAGRAVLYTGENLAYCVRYDRKQKRFELCTCAMTEDGPDKNWKAASRWLFDPQEDGMSAAETIANDFVETIQGPKRMAAMQTARKKRRREDENNPDPVFFFNRCVGVLPDLHEELIYEKASYPEVRGVTFARDKVLPKLEQLALGGRDDARRKMCELLNDMYVRGDMDVRSIITIVLLNGLTPPALEKLRASFGDDLEKGCKAALKYRGKTVKPEKVKKQKRYVADSLNSMR